MIKFENVEVTGWEAAIRGMRNPKNSWAKSDSGWDAHVPPVELRNQVDWKEWADHYKTVQYSDEYSYDIGPNDLDLMTRLRNAGTDHRKFMRMIAVYLDITAPLYWWKEFDTYKVGTVANSCSTMHKIAANEFTLDDFSHEHLFPTAKKNLESTIDILNGYRDQYNVDTNPELRKEYWWQMIQLLPSSYNQRRTIMLNYEVLANIYKSRRNHKLDEWHAFCDWVKTLPYSELITGAVLGVDLAHGPDTTGEQKGFCIDCDHIVPLIFKRRMIEQTEKGISFSYAEDYAICMHCKNEVYVPSLNDRNAKVRASAYFKEKENLKEKENKNA